MLPSCGQAEEADTSQQAAADPIQVAQAQPGCGTSGSSTGGDKPNILVIWGDDVGYWNVSAYNQGMMGYETPNIDSVANEGAPFGVQLAQLRHCLLDHLAVPPHRANHPPVNVRLAVLANGRVAEIHADSPPCSRCCRRFVHRLARG